MLTSIIDILSYRHKTNLQTNVPVEIGRNGGNYQQDQTGRSAPTMTEAMPNSLPVGVS